MVLHYQILHWIVLIKHMRILILSIHGYLCMICAVRYMMQRSHVITYFQNGENLLRWTNPFAPTHNEKFHAWDNKKIRAAQKCWTVLGPFQCYVAALRNMHAQFFDQCVMYMWSSHIHFLWFLYLFFDILWLCIAYILDN